MKKIIITGLALIVQVLSVSAQKKSILLIAYLLIALGTIQAQEIFNALSANDLSRVKNLIKKDVTLVNQKDSEENTPLHIAADSGYVKIAKYLLNKGGDISAKNYKGNTPLHIAAESGKLAIVMLLLKNKAGIDAVNSQLRTSLHLSIINAKDDISKILIEQGSDIRKQDRKARTPLHYAARYNCIAIAELLIAKGVDIECRDDYQRTPLNLLTLLTTNIDMASLLIQKGADINALNSFGNMPLNHAAYYSDSPELINLFIKNKARFDTTRRHTFSMLYSAARLGSADLFNYIIKNGGDDLFSNESDNKVFMRSALSGGSLDIVKFLQEKNIPVNVEANIYGWTPLHYAASGNKIAIIEFLVKNGVEINKRTKSGKSAYNLAKEKSYKKLQELILTLGGNSEPKKFPTLTGPYLGQTPPGNEPEIFAPGIVSSEHSSITISPDGREMYWQSNSLIMMTKLQNGQWTMPEIVSFIGTAKTVFNDDVPFVSPDNKKMFFTSRRPIGSSKVNKENIWFVERTTNGWSEPKQVSTVVNALSLHWHVSVSNSTTLYFGGDRDDGYGSGDIYYSRFVNGIYVNPLNIGSVINTKDGEGSPFIAPDESYILFSKVVSGRGKLHVSFKSKDGQWLKPISLEPYIKFGNCPMISPDGKYLFYLHSDDIYWVSAKIIDDLKPNELK